MENNNRISHRHPRLWSLILITRIKIKTKNPTNHWVIFVPLLQLPAVLLSLSPPSALIWPSVTGVCPDPQTDPVEKKDKRETALQRPLVTCFQNHVTPWEFEWLCNWEKQSSSSSKT